MLITSVKTDPIMMFAEDVRAGLTKPGQKELPSKYFYDEIGSALFDVITILPEYGLTRADERLLRKYADAIAARTSSPAMVVELGSGNGKKAQWILNPSPGVSLPPIALSNSPIQRCLPVSTKSTTWRASASWDLRLSILTACGGLQAGAPRISVCWCCFWAVRLAILIQARRRISCGISVISLHPATRSC